MPQIPTCPGLLEAEWALHFPQDALTLPLMPFMRLCRSGCRGFRGCLFGGSFVSKRPGPPNVPFLLFLGGLSSANSKRYVFSVATGDPGREPKAKQCCFGDNGSKRLGYTWMTVRVLGNEPRPSPLCNAFCFGGEFDLE